MEVMLWVIIEVLVIIVAVLIIKIHYFKKSAREIREALADRLITDTNTLIDISSGDKDMRDLANSVNKALRTLREKERRFTRGDNELKTAALNISHDLRTPLTAIFGYTELLLKENISDTARRYIEIIKNRADALGKLTEELFKYSVIVAAENDEISRPIIINDTLCESVAAFYIALRERNITPKISLPENKIVRYGNQDSLSRVFSNLLNNVIKYSDGDLDITLYENGEIIFSNTATSLDDVEVGRLFDRFYTVDTARRSSGLGLSIAKTLIQKMGGSITARYENGRLYISVILTEKQPDY